MSACVCVAPTRVESKGLEPCYLPHMTTGGDQTVKTVNGSESLNRRRIADCASLELTLILLLKLFILSLRRETNRNKGRLRTAC